MPVTLRFATPDDAPHLVRLIHELAVYEKLEDQAEPDVETLRRHLAPDAQPRCEALLAVDEDTNEAVGFALFFPSYSTFLTRWGVYLEDLYVQPDYRGRGVGFALLRRVAQTAVERDARRLDWAVLDWNEPAIAFYRRLGAEPMDDWTTMRLSGDALQKLGEANIVNGRSI